ncbi:MULTISPECIES: DUF4446 family protein [Aneurinibacillus]|uniref:DUF4446 domain-containing protein n=1 Tax=Aneurinibacillus danicus TaxID=267746 RepID=A0A511V1K9_9BACL|nr:MULTISPECIES: DUF4446 family protein [Aneurinibacillus]GEN32775.1 hypothetical protein ADA01nite_02350 [Aneurinibacillus danicus]
MEVWFTKEIVAGIFGLLLILFLVLFIWNIILSVKFGRLKKRFRRMAQGTSKDNLEQMLEKLFDRMEALEASQQEVERLTEIMHTKVREQKGRLGIIRFSAFENEGSDLSFSLALVDDNQDGMVMTSIYGRHESRVYAKPVEKGSSLYALSEEERQALAMAVKNNVNPE